MKRGVLMGMALALASAGCVAGDASARHASPSSPSLAYASERAPRAPGPSDEAACAMEAPTGSHVRRTVCRSDRSIEARRLATLDTLRRTRGALDDLDFRGVERVYGYPPPPPSTAPAE